MLTVVPQFIIMLHCTSSVCCSPHCESVTIGTIIIQLQAPLLKDSNQQHKAVAMAVLCHKNNVLCIESMTVTDCNSVTA